MPGRKSLFCCILTAIGVAAAMTENWSADLNRRLSKGCTQQDQTLTGDSNRTAGASVCRAELRQGDPIPGMPGYYLGKVLPSPGFIRDNIQYFPKGTDFPLSNELNAQQAAEAEKAANLAR